MLGTANKLKTARQIALTGAVSGSANFDGSGNVSITTTQANIAVLTGTITGTANNSSSEQGNININYPTGFNSNNCVVIAIGLSRKDDNTPFNYGVLSASDSAIARVAGAIGRTVQLGADNMTLRTYFYFGSPQNESVTYNYKIVLMKIS